MIPMTRQTFSLEALRPKYPLYHPSEAAAVLGLAGSLDKSTYRKKKTVRSSFCVEHFKLHQSSEKGEE